MSLLEKGLTMAAGRMPKVISPSAHAVIDYALAGSFLVMGAWLWRRNKRAAIGSILCGGSMVLNSALTDYPGGLTDVISYKSHGRIDVGVAGLTAALPRFMDFEDEPEARFFQRQALAETAVAALTDFNYYERRSLHGMRGRDDEDVA